MKKLAFLVGALVALVTAPALERAVESAAQYPSGVKSFVTRTAGQTIQPAHINDLQDEVAAIETGLLSGLAHSLLPLSDSTYALGSTGVRWSAVWTDALTVTDTFSVGGGISATTGTFSGALTGTTLDTGQGANELYDMDQNVLTTSAVTFGGVTDTGVFLMSGTTAGASGKFNMTGTHGGGSVAGNTYGLLLNTGLTPDVDDIAAGQLINFTLTEAASGTHPLLASLYLTPPVVTGAGASVTDAATLYISNPPTATVTGGTYSLFVDSGETRLDGLLSANGAVTGALTTPSNLTCNSSTEDTITLGNVSFIRLTTAGSGNCIVKGMTAPTTGTGGRILVVLNATGQAVVFNDEDASEATAANRIATAGTVNAITVDNIGIFVYDPTTQRWRGLAQTAS